MTFPKPPPDYVLWREIELQKDPALYRKVQILGFGIAAVMVLAALPFVPLSLFVPIHAPSRTAALRILLLLPGIYVCRLLRELLRGAVLRYNGKQKCRFQRFGVSFSVGSDVFLDRRSFLLVLASPAAILGAVLMILNFALPLELFWFVYVIQIVNLSGAAGDLFLMHILSRLPRSILIHDGGERVEIYARAGKTK